MKLSGILFIALIAATTASAQQDPTAAPAGAKPILTLLGEGVQIYACKDTPTGPAWTFTAPQATLLNHTTKAGTHFAGPTWTLTDGSSVKGKLLATSPSPDPNAIPWLLLQAAETKGPGTLSTVAYIRRSETQGGKARTTGCDAAHLGTADQVPYKATYTFYTAQ